MNATISRFVLLTSVTLMSASVMSATPTVIGCNKKDILAKLSIQAEAWTSTDALGQPTCPLIEEKRSRRFVDTFGVGSVFGHPEIPYSCLSGAVTAGTLQLQDGTAIDIDPFSSYSESAQRLFPVPAAQGGVSLFATSLDESLQTGAAMTYIHLEGDDLQGTRYGFNLLLDDRFLLTPTAKKKPAVEDTEDFLILASTGDYKMRGRLTGRGNVLSLPKEPLYIVFEISGLVCLR